jgi:hypothetical protein
MRLISILVTAIWLTACADDPESARDTSTDTAPDADEVTDADADSGSGSDTVDDADTSGPDLSESLAGRLPTEVPEGYELIELGALPTLDGETEDFQVEVPVGTVTLHVVAATDADATVVLLGARSPSGEWVVVDEAPAGVSREDADKLASGFGPGILSHNKTVALPRASTTLIPNTPEVGLEPGVWTFRAGAFDVTQREDGSWDRAPDSTALTVRVLLRTEPVPTSGVIDLILSFDPSSGFSAAEAEADDDILRSIDILDEALAEVGLAVGEVQFRDVALSTGIIPLSQPACSTSDALANVFDEAPAPSRDVVHVVFLDYFTCPKLGGLFDAGQQIAALSIGAPGVPFGTRTGILAATFAKPTYPIEWSEILAHEVGHYLGLFHTRESLGGIVDNIADTANDEEGAKANLMFFNVTLSTATTLTPDQGQIVRSSPLVKAR